MADLLYLAWGVKIVKIILSGFLYAAVMFILMTVVSCDEGGSDKKSPFNSYVPVLNGKLFYAAEDPDNAAYGRELWTSDGTSDGTAMVKNINASSNEGSYPGYFIVCNGKVFFTADDGENGNELWVSDGTENGTRMVMDIYPGTGASVPYNFVVFKNKLYFVANDGTSGAELWVSDGIETGTFMVKNINETAGDPSQPDHFTVYRGKLYFAADDGTTNGVELWVSDGTANGTTLFCNINANTADNVSSSPAGFTELDGKLYFAATDSSGDRELWVTDGVAGDGHTYMVKGFNSAGSGNPDNLKVFDGKLCLTADDGNGNELWVYDADKNTAVNLDINTADDGDRDPSGFTEFNDRLYFAATDGGGDRELWCTDGTVSGTFPVANIYDSGSSSPDFLTVYDGALYFAADDGANGVELWATDGDSASRVKDIYTGSGSSYPNAGYWIGSVYNCTFIISNDLMFFAAATGGDANLYVSDGTAEGTGPVTGGACYF